MAFGTKERGWIVYSLKVHPTEMCECYPFQLPLFELLSEGYINFNTMKGGCFLTDGRHVACGSENLQVRCTAGPRC